MIYRSRHFELRELVDRPIFEERGEKAWVLLNPQALMTLDAMREKFGPIIVNDWHTGGSYHESGLRSPLTTTGSKWSMHKFGCAFDCKPRACRPRDMYDYVLAYPDDFPHINRVENIALTPTWFHWDTGNSASRIEVVNP